MKAFFHLFKHDDNYLMVLILEFKDSSRELLVYRLTSSSFSVKGLIYETEIEKFLYSAFVMIGHPDKLYVRNEEIEGIELKTILEDEIKLKVAAFPLEIAAQMETIAAACLPGYEKTDEPTSAYVERLKTFRFICSRIFHNAGMFRSPLDDLQERISKQMDILLDRANSTGDIKKIFLHICDFLEYLMGNHKDMKKRFNNPLIENHLIALEEYIEDMLLVANAFPLLEVNDHVYFYEDRYHTIQRGIVRGLCTEGVMIKKIDGDKDEVCRDIYPWYILKLDKGQEQPEALHV